MPDNEYFQGNPIRLERSRSVMTPRPPRWWGSWNAGRLVPIFATSLVMPGDTFGQSVTSAIRSVRPVFPVMDDVDITIEAYFVPHRLVMSRKSMSPDLNDSQHSWAAFIGAQDSLLNMPTPGDVKLPAMQIAQSSFVVGSLGDCLGYHCPQASGGTYYVNALKALSYYSIWNEYFREPNTMAPVTYNIVSSSQSPTGSFVVFTGSDAGVPSSSGGSPSTFPLAPVSRYHGYFGSALPWPQRNSAQVEMPLGATAPVFAGAVNPVAPGQTGWPSGYAAAPLVMYDPASWTLPSASGMLGVNSGNGGVAQDASGAPGVNYLTPANLFADLASATAASVNQFRLAVQTQRWYEHLARSGNKYSDLVHGMFGVRGVSIPDRPEYLGGFTMPLSMSQVAQTTDGSANDGLGKVGAFSLSNPGGFLYSKSFTEHGTLMIVMCCRVTDSFAQGIAREDTKFDRFDYYWPEFANLGEQPILNKELFVRGDSSGIDDLVFGYQEAWAEYRMFNDIVTGYMNPNESTALEFATYTNVFVTTPTLKGFLNAKDQVDNIDRTLAVGSSTAGFQFYGEFFFPTRMTRPMPLYSIPGLVDHH